MFILNVEPLSSQLQFPSLQDLTSWQYTHKDPQHKVLSGGAAPSRDWMGWDVSEWLVYYPGLICPYAPLP